ncbi:hypothetical protein Cni_G25109 [Canna indica]|uniref:Uncharacterized protein n=1 Tax=Canna indica TaxID=4628 RepID=A0AAQ3L3R2_9LILI|nr:hypothetical protein Cni_G25109 [Canna indica]
MLSRGSAELPKPSLQIKEDDKFYGRLMSKETSLAQPSFRVYYGVAPGAVPFLWESQPGTPKHAAADPNPQPPLTPPPSYYYSKSKSSTTKPHKSGLIHIILPKLTSMRKSISFSSSSPSSLPKGAHHRRLSSSRSSWSSRCDDDESSADDGSPRSTLCFGGLRGYFSTAAATR